MRFWQGHTVTEPDFDPRLLLFSGSGPYSCARKQTPQAWLFFSPRLAKASSQPRHEMGLAKHPGTLQSRDLAGFGPFHFQRASRPPGPTSSALVSLGRSLLALLGAPLALTNCSHTFGLNLPPVLRAGPASPPPNPAEPLQNPPPLRPKLISPITGDQRRWIKFRSHFCSRHKPRSRTKNSSRGQLNFLPCDVITRPPPSITVPGCPPCFPSGCSCKDPPSPRHTHAHTFINEQINQLFFTCASVKILPRASSKVTHALPLLPHQSQHD